MTCPSRQPCSAELLTDAENRVPKPLPSGANHRREGAVLAAVLKVLRQHPAIAWVERQNSGAYKDGKRFIRYGWPGCADILGQLQDGRFLAVEVKAPAGRLRPEQAAFLELVLQHGGVAFVARSLDDINTNLALQGVSPTCT